MVRSREKMLPRNGIVGGCGMGVMTVDGEEWDVKCKWDKVKDLRTSITRI